MLTNSVGLLVPEPGFHEALRAATREAGTLLCYDETHTQVVGPGGLTSMWSLEPDVVTIGKSIAGGVPLGAYGMTDEVAETLRRPAGRDDEKPVDRDRRHAVRQPAVDGGGAGDDGRGAHARGVRAHAGRSAGGWPTASRGRSRRAGLPWTTHRFWPRSGYTFAPSMPRDADEAYEALDVPLRRLIRVYLANRGVWEAIIGAGPTCSVPATEGDVDAYVDAFGSLLEELTS